MEDRLVPYEAVNRIGADRVLILAPHPDDEVFGCGGALAIHVAHGDPVDVVVLTDGELGGSKADGEDLISIRQSESVAAARILGYGAPMFWGLPDRGVEYGEPLVRRIVELLVESKADLVYAPSIFEMHPDHRAVGMAALEAVRRAGDGIRLAMYEVGVPLPRLNVLLDIGSVWETKLRAMASFPSQLRNQAYDQQIAALNRFRTYTLGVGIQAAEAYLVVSGATLQYEMLGVYESEYQRQRRLGMPFLPADKPLVSVLIRSMNRAFLSRALDSVALQTYPNVEVVVVNASGVAHQLLGDVCGRFPMRLIEPGVQLERSRAANMALDHSLGEFLVFLDDDDWFAANHIEKLVAFLMILPEALAVHTATVCVDGDGKVCGPVFERAHRPVFQKMGNFLPIHSVLFRRELLKKGCRFDESLTLYEDWDFWLQVGQYTDIPMVPGVSAFYWLHQSSGVHDEASVSGESHRKIFRKWHPRWSEDEVVALMRELQQWDRHQDDLAAARAEIALRDQDISHLNEVISTRDQEIARCDQEIARRDQEIARRDQEIVRRDQEIVRRDQKILLHNEEASRFIEAIRSREALIAELQGSLEAVHLSTSWRITAPLRWLRQIVR